MSVLPPHTHLHSRPCILPLTQIVFEAKLPHLYMSLIYCIVFIKDNVGQRPFVVKNVIILEISKEHVIHVNGNLN